jgi:hypothetical protein
MIYLAAYILTIFGANWAISTFGLVPVGFGLLAPAGVYFAGLSFTLRDLAQDRLGKGWTIAAILVGAALSALLSPPWPSPAGPRSCSRSWPTSPSTPRSAGALAGGGGALQHGRAADRLGAVPLAGLPQRSPSCRGRWSARW